MTKHLVHSSLINQRFRFLITNKNSVPVGVLILKFIQFYISIPVFCLTLISIVNVGQKSLNIEDGADCWSKASVTDGAAL
jgi:hypothetical protein